LDAQTWLNGEGLQHHGFPVVRGDALVGVVTRRELVAQASDPSLSVAQLIARKPVFIEPSASARDAADLMAREAIGRLPVLDHGRVVGIVTRSDLIEAHSRRINSEQARGRVRRIKLRLARP